MGKLKLISLGIAVLLCVTIPAFGADITLSWEAPTKNVDGTPLTDLAGYKIYSSKISGVYNKEDAIDVGNVLTKTLINLCECTYYFVATAYDTSGNESEYSNEVGKVVKIAPAAPYDLIELIGE